MQHARFYFGLIALSMVLPSSPLKAGSFDKFPQQHVSNSLDTSNNTSADAAQQVENAADVSEPKDEQAMLTTHAKLVRLPIVTEPLKPYTAEELFKKYNAKFASEIQLTEVQKEKTLKATASDDALKNCMAHGKTRKDCLQELYEQAVKANAPECSYAIAKEILAEKNVSELEKEKAKLKKAQDAQNKFYLKVAGGVVLVTCLVCGYGGYKLGSNVKAEPALTEAGIAAAVTTALATKILTSEQTQAAAVAGVQPLLQALTVPLNVEQTQAAVTAALAPVQQAIQALPQAAAAD